ncbi:MAG: hypothetical protein CMM56_07480 [Rhodospirillaceae bacterium]|nr:hypothetical protein [Rhodospirillaceae bacterium]
MTAVVYTPDNNPEPHIAFLIAHRTGNSLDNIACRELAIRGFMAVCFNTRFVNNETKVRWETLALDVKVAMDFVRNKPGIEKVILLGHSGGSPLMSFYQAVAENGVSFCSGANKLIECNEKLAGLMPADGMVYPDAHPGNGVQALHGLNPSLSIVDGSVLVDPFLDPFNPDNGFNPNGASKYTEEFRDRYYQAQSRVMNKKIEEVLTLQDRIASGQHIFPDEDIVLVPFDAQAGAARLDAYDPTITETMSTEQPRKFLKNNGTIEFQIARSVALPKPMQAQVNRTFIGGVKILTTESFLSANAVLSAHAMDDIDHCSTNASTNCAIANIEAPTLIAAMGAYNHIRFQELMFEDSPAPDKDFIVIEGASHGYTPCIACEEFPGQYSNSMKNLFDYIAQWANARF